LTFVGGNRFPFAAFSVHFELCRLTEDF
jgi:hypothetical protein